MDGSGAREAIDSGPLIDEGRIRIVDLELDTEHARFIDFAARLADDGEAITGAIAVESDWAIGTDDRAAIRFFAQRCPQLQIVSSLELLKHWAEETQSAAADLAHALRWMHVRGRSQPHRTHALFDWWHANYS
ncbi:MAG: hypothetical protein HXY39_02205 [Chloroflexi bacterium]|nr:hypothetical protein [Chloroflexota bacterium]